MTGRFLDVGAPGHMAHAWFAGLLRDGFALTVVGSNAAFSHVGAEAMRVSLDGLPLNRSTEDAVEHIMRGFGVLHVHADVPAGIRALADRGIRLVPLSNGSTDVAQRLLDQAGINGHFERLLSVQDAGVWKPAAGAYAHALAECRAEPMDAMLVAVHPWDIDGASRAGLATAWINRGHGRYPDYFEAPDVEASSLTHLAQLLH